MYRPRRTIRIGKVVSFSVWARRGITAGSGFATIGMRLVMVRAVDWALKAYPIVKPTLFVDDLAADIIALRKMSLRNWVVPLRKLRSS